MHTLIKTLAFAATLGASAYAAPGLTINGTDFQYNGKKIFFSGTNLAWTNYNSDVGDAALDENAWRKAVEGTRAAGGNVIRWWLFNNMGTSPALDESTHLVSGLKTNTIANMKKALDIANEYGVMVSMCLFSHNLMEFSQWGDYNDKLDSTANLKLLTTDEGTQAFITNALIPVVDAIGNHAALLTWEVFNEPEGMTSVGWTTRKIDKAYLQKFTNKVAAAIHKENSALLVSTGSVNIQYQSWWNDAALIAAGGESTGTLDFFQTHYYPYYQADAVSPFINTRAALASTYSFDNDKPMIIGEFPASGWSGSTYTTSMAAKTQLSTVQCYRKAFDNGYAGALAWQYIGDKTDASFGGYTYTIDPALAAMDSLWMTDSASIKIKDYTASVDTGNGRMAVSFASNDNGKIEYQKDFDLSKASTFSFTVKNNGAEAADIYLIFKLTSAWTWTETAGSCNVAAGETKTCSFDISTFSGRNVTKSIILANYTAGYTGTLLFDDIVAGTDTLFNFNKDKYDAFGREANVTEAVIPEIKIVFNNPDYVYTAGIPTLAEANKAQAIRYATGTLQLSLARAGFVTVNIYTVNGNKAMTLYNGTLSAGTHTFNLGKLANGLYVVRARTASGTATQKILVK
jgi:hypothetical protein